jgi:hypothetical protein
VRRGGRDTVPRRHQLDPWIAARGQDSVARHSVQLLSVGASRGRGPGPVTATAFAFAFDQLMLRYLDRDLRQVEDLAALHPAHRPSPQPGPAPAAPGRLMPHLPIRPGRLRQRRTRMPVLPAGLAAGLFPQRPRPRRRLASPSPDGGLDEFRGVCLSRTSSSAIRSRACASSTAGRASAACESASSARSEATSAASTSSPEPASSPGTSGRYYHPRPAAPRSASSGTGPELAR